MLCLSGCSNNDKSTSSNIKDKQDDNTLNLLITYDKEFEEAFMGVYTDIIFNKFIENFSFKNDIEINKTYLNFSTQSDLKKKLASIAYNSTEYDIVIFNNSYVRYPFENDEIMESLEQLSNYTDIFNGLKNKYFVPMAYSTLQKCYSKSMIEELNLENEIPKEKLYNHEIEALYFRKNNFFPTQNVMETEALIMDLDYKITENGLEINRDSVKYFRDELSKILKDNYNLVYNDKPEHIKNVFKQDYKAWDGLEQKNCYQSGLLKENCKLPKLSSVIDAEEYLNGTKYDEEYSVYFTRISPHNLDEMIHMGVFKSSSNKEIALKFVDEYISENHQQKLANETAAARGLVRGIINRNNVEYLSQKEEKLGADKKHIELRNKIFDDLDGEIGSFISYNQFSKEQLKIDVMYIVRPYILDTYNAKEVDKKIKELEETINVRLFEDK